jgi:phosphinothricin acetyltransferase
VSGRETIRPATIADAAQLAEIYNETVAAGDATMDLVPRTAAELARDVESLGERERMVVLAEGESILGWGSIRHYSEREGYARAAETAVYLRRSLRRRGLGTLLKRHLLDRCRRLGHHHLVAKVFARNQASIEYNLRLGYEIVGTQREIGWVQGRWEDVIIMQLVLDDVDPADQSDKQSG